MPKGNKKPGLLAQATIYSNHILDWSRIGSLITSNHKYSTNEILVRGAIISTILASAYFGQDAAMDLFDCNKYLASAISGLCGFVVSHTVAIVPLVLKRTRMQNNCLQLNREITEISNNFTPEQKYKIRQLVTDINDLCLTTDTQGRASQTWGQRQRELTSLLEMLRHSPQQVFNPQSTAEQYSAAQFKSQSLGSR